MEAPNDLDHDFPESPEWGSVEGDVPPPSIEDMAQAERHMKAHRHWGQEIDRIRAHAAGQRDLVDRWERAQLKDPLLSMAWHETGLIRFLINSGKKHIDLIWGRISKSAGRPSIEIQDEYKYYAWVGGKKYDSARWEKSHEGFFLWLFGPDGGEIDRARFDSFVTTHTEYSPKKKSISEYIKANKGEIPDGTDTRTGPDTFKVETI